MADSTQRKLTKRPKPKKAHEKMKIAGELFEFAMRVKSHQLRLRHPEWSDQQVKTEALASIERGNR